MIVSDKFAVVNVAGLRVAKRVDRNRFGDHIDYMIELVYKGKDVEINYGRDESARNSMFEQICAARTRPSGGPRR